jgi:colicin import membrane protein
MAYAAPYLEFAPPPAKGSPGALALAVLAHAALLVVLTMGVQWKSDPVSQVFEAELWSAIPVEAAAPAALEPEPPKPVPPKAKPEPLPIPVERPEAIAKADAAIALAKEKEKQKAKDLKEKKLALEKLQAEKKKQAELEKQLEKDKKDKAEKLARAKDEQQRKQDQKEAQQIADQRQKTLKRLESMAGAGGAGAPNSTSTALEAKAPSDSYKGRIRAYIKRFHIYTETVVGNPVTEVEIRTASDGTILSRKITKSSGIKSWDEATLNAIDKAERLPLDEYGHAPPPMILVWSAQDLAR